MHLDYGLVYGGSYFTSQNTSALLEVARRISRDSGANATLDDVSEFLDSPRNRKLFKDADQVRMCFNFLREYPQLSESNYPENDILFDRAIDDSEVIYCFLQTLTEPTSARIVAGLCLYTAVQAAMRRVKSGKPLKKPIFAVDEFQSIIGPNLGTLLAQSRKFGCGFILLNQSTSQLENRDVDLSDVVFEGTSTKVYFTCVGRKDIEDLQCLSGETIRVLGGTSTAKFAQSTSTREVVVPKLELDTILKVSATFGQAFAVLNHGDGNHEPIVIELKHHFQDLSNVPMPARAKEAAPRQTAITPKTDAATSQRRRILAKLLAAKRADEEWDGTGNKQVQVGGQSP